MSTKPIPFPQHAVPPAEKPRTIAGILASAGGMAPDRDGDG